jgi:CBS domain-containing protein
MNAIDVMSMPVVTITPQTPVQQIATLLVERRISGVPVVDKGRVVGLVNEFDLLRRHEIGTEGSAPARSWWVQLIERDPRPTEYVRSHAQHAKDVMTRQVISVAEDTPVRKIASIFAARAVRGIVVLRGQQLVGIVTRANLVQALALTAQTSPAPRAQSDDAIRVRLLSELEAQPWWRPGQSAAYVHDGVVHYRGLVESEDERRAARVAAENVPGVRGVEDTRTRWSAWQGLY